MGARAFCLSRAWAFLRSDLRKSNIWYVHWKKSFSSINLSQQHCLTDNMTFYFCGWGNSHLWWQWRETIHFSQVWNPINYSQSCSMWVNKPRKRFCIITVQAEEENKEVLQLQHLLLALCLCERYLLISNAWKCSFETEPLNFWYVKFSIHNIPGL